MPPGLEDLWARPERLSALASPQASCQAQVPFSANSVWTVWGIRRRFQSLLTDSLLSVEDEEPLHESDLDQGRVSPCINPDWICCKERVASRVGRAVHCFSQSIRARLGENGRHVQPSSDTQATM